MVRQWAFLRNSHPCITSQLSIGVEELNFPVISEKLPSTFILKYIYNGLIYFFHISFSVYVLLKQAQSFTYHMMKITVDKVPIKWYRSDHTTQSGIVLTSYLNEKFTYHCNLISRITVTREEHCSFKI